MNELSCVTLRKVDPSKNMARQYSVAVCRDLFGTPVVVCRWGRIGRAGRSSQQVCGSLEEAQALAEELVEKRRSRGYIAQGVKTGPHTQGQNEASTYERTHAESSTPRRRRGRARVTDEQLCLLDWAAQHASTSEDGFALMRRLRKPATFAERERAMSLLTLAASLRGISLVRGSSRHLARV